MSGLTSTSNTSHTKTDETFNIQ